MGYSIYHWIVIGLIVLIVAGPFIVRARLYTLESYRRDNPDCVKPGRVACKHCSGTSLWMKRKAFFVGTGWAHTCRTCGQELYYSG